MIIIHFEVNQKLWPSKKCLGFLSVGGEELPQYPKFTIKEEKNEDTIFFVFF